MFVVKAMYSQNTTKTTDFIKKDPMRISITITDLLGTH